MKKLQFLDYSIFKPRLYQELISSTAIEKNTLCILPTGLGKTYVALMVGAHRLEKFPDSKILMLAPTRPLVHQHLRTFKKHMILGDTEFIALTGKIHASDRKVLYTKNKVFFATPQLIRNDVENKILDLKDFSLLIVDECHRSVKNYAYTSVVEYYVKQSSNPLVLGLTASPGGISDKIDEVKKHLHVEAVEIRTEKDHDVQPYVQKTEIEKIFVELPEEFKKIKIELDEAYRIRLEKLLRVRVIHSMKVSKKDLLLAQSELGKMYSQTKDFMVASALVTCAESIKIGHAVELIETQGISSLYEYFSKLSRDKKSSASKRVLNDPRIMNAISQTKELQIKGADHPKLTKLIEIVKNEVREKPSTKIIVFANYRSAVEKIAKLLQLEKIEAREFIGQAVKKGKSLSQKEQIEILNEFNLEMFNVLVGTSVSEEGIDINEVDVVIFYEPVPSEIRTIQRRGRTGRTKSGRVIFLITKDTRDEWYYWSAYHKEMRMKRILKDLKNNNSIKNLSDYVK